MLNKLIAGFAHSEWNNKISGEHHNYELTKFQLALEIYVNQLDNYTKYNYFYYQEKKTAKDLPMNFSTDLQMSFEDFYKATANFGKAFFDIIEKENINTIENYQEKMAALSLPTSLLNENYKERLAEILVKKTQILKITK